MFEALGPLFWLSFALQAEPSSFAQVSYTNAMQKETRAAFKMSIAWAFKGLLAAKLLQPPAW